MLSVLRSARTNSSSTYNRPCEPRHLFISGVVRDIILPIGVEDPSIKHIYIADAPEWRLLARGCGDDVATVFPEDNRVPLVAHAGNAG